jgi:hypothetical protein
MIDRESRGLTPHRRLQQVSALCTATAFGLLLLGRQYEPLRGWYIYGFAILVLISMILQIAAHVRHGR